jgi:hypothetical protein
MRKIFPAPAKPGRVPGKFWPWRKRVAVIIIEKKCHAPVQYSPNARRGETQSEFRPPPQIRARKNGKTPVYFGRDMDHSKKKQWYA